MYCEFILFVYTYHILSVNVQLQLKITIKMKSLKYCELCLVTDVKMYNMSVSSIGNAYSRLLQIHFSNENEQHICFECAALLNKYDEFQKKCQRAYYILSNMKQDKIRKVMEQIIQNVDRKENKLESKLSVSPVTIFNDEFRLPNDSSDYDELFYLDEIKLENSIEPLELLDSNTIKKSNTEFYDTENKQETVNYDDLTDDYTLNSDHCIHEIAVHKNKRHKINKKGPKCKRKKPISDENEINVVKNDENNDLYFDSSDDIPLGKSPFQSTSNTEKNKNVIRKNVDLSFFDDYATVVFLTTEDARQEVLLRKESSNYKNCPFKCDLCYRGFGAQSTFDNHMKKHSPEYGEFECDCCHLRFPDKLFLSKHRLSCHKRKFSCKICPYICFSTHQMKSHISLHKGKKYPCKDCGEIFSMPNSLFMHKRIKHATEVVCDICGSTFATDRGLYSHKMLLHRQDKNSEQGPQCEECGVHFATEVAWKRHLVLSSKHKIDNGCEYCGETFSDGKALKRHQRVHARKQNRPNAIKLPASCAMCNKWLTTRSEYKLHTTSDHPDSDAAKQINANEKMQCVCEICGKMFKQRCFLWYHQRSHDNARPFSCADCGASYSAPASLHAHRVRHKPAAAAAARAHCDNCDRVYATRSALAKHVRKDHLGLRPHKCTICDKAFLNPYEVKAHTRYVHYKVPWPKRDRSKKKKMAERTEFEQCN